MEERSGLVTMKGNGITLEGRHLKEGDKAPDCRLKTQELEDIKLSSLYARKKTVLIISLPSLDTSVCEKEARQFNHEADQFGDDLISVTVSRDLPFAQSRWCAKEGVKNLMILSDYHYREFGNNFGLSIKELGLLARAVFIIDPEGTIRYIQLVKEVTSEPDYKEVNDQIRQLLPVR